MNPKQAVLKDSNDLTNAYVLYQVYCAQLEDELTHEKTMLLWKTYRNLRAEEAYFVSPCKAYLAGKEVKLNYRTEVNTAYQFYVQRIQKDKRHQLLKEERQIIFDELLASLPTAYLQDRLTKIDRLYDQFSTFYKGQMQTFFHQGFICGSNENVF